MDINTVLILGFLFLSVSIFYSSLKLYKGMKHICESINSLSFKNFSTSQINSVPEKSKNKAVPKGNESIDKDLLKELQSFKKQEDNIQVNMNLDSKSEKVDDKATDALEFLKRKKNDEKE